MTNPVEGAIEELVPGDQSVFAARRQAVSLRNKVRSPGPDSPMSDGLEDMLLAAGDTCDAHARLIETANTLLHRLRAERKTHTAQLIALREAAAHAVVAEAAAESEFRLGDLRRWYGLAGTIRTIFSQAGVP